MKEAELRQHVLCNICGHRIGESGLPLFWRVTVERFGLDMAACRRQQGLGLQLGAVLAAVMGPDEDLAKPMYEKPLVLTVCENCCTENTCIAHLAEVAPQPKEPA